MSENHWDAIAAAVDLVLPDHPQGILIDCGQLKSMTDKGGSTFMDGLSYMEARGARIILCNIPDPLSSRLRSIPGLHSQVPMAQTVKDGRKSLVAGNTAPLTSNRGDVPIIIVPVSPPFSAPACRPLLKRLNLGTSAAIHYVYVMVVPRALPVGAPLPDEEARAQIELTLAEEMLLGPVTSRHVLRGRSISDALVEAVRRLGCIEVIAGLDSTSLSNDAVPLLVSALREKCPCVLTITQSPAVVPSPSTSPGAAAKL